MSSLQASSSTSTSSSSPYSLSSAASTHTGAVSQMPAAVCQLSAVSSEREDSEGYLKWRGSYITLRCHTLESINQRRPRASKPALTHLILFPLAHIVRQLGLRCACGEGGGDVPAGGKMGAMCILWPRPAGVFSSSQIKQTRSIRRGVSVAHVNQPGWAQKQTGSVLLRRLNHSYDGHGGAAGIF